MALGANRGNVVSLVVSRALLLVAIIPGPSLSKVSLVCCSLGRCEDVVHFSGLSAHSASIPYPLVTGVLIIKVLEFLNPFDLRAAEQP
jgi:hypothetical protein